MPSLAASQSPLIGAGYEAAPQVETPIPQQLPPSEGNQPSPFMVSSLPATAATLDQYVRQFYNRSNVPMFRIMQPGIAE